MLQGMTSVRSATAVRARHRPWVAVLCVMINVLPARATVINFDDVTADFNGTEFPGNLYSARGVTFTRGSIPDAVAVGDAITLSDPQAILPIAGNFNSISEPNFAAPAFGQTPELLMAFSTPVTSVRLTSDDASPELPDVIRLLALAPGAGANQYTVLALAQGRDDAVAPPDNLLSVDLVCAPFSYALFQTPTESEGFDDLTFTPIPEPSALAMAMAALSAVAVVLRRRGRGPRTT